MADFRFNGAALFQVRKVPANRSAEDGLQQLQWGRTLSSAESDNRLSKKELRERLQWGRTLSSAERTPTPTPQDGLHPLQWGRTLSSAESHTSQLVEG